MMSGGYDFLPKIVSNEIVDYQDTNDRLLEGDLGIDKYFSYVVLRSPIVRHHMPLERLFNS